MDYLRGPPKKMLIGMEITNGNYPDAIRMLKERFGGEALIITSLHKSLTNLTKAGESYHEFKRLVENIQIITNQLRRLGDNVNQTSTEVSIMEKLPMWAALKILEIKESTPAGDWNATFLIQKLVGMLTIRETAYGFTEKQKQPPTKNSNRSERTYSAHAAVDEPKQKRCLLCDENHWTSLCKKYATFSERAKRILELDKCFKCLKTGHKGNDCK